MAKNKKYFLLFLVVALAFFLRIYNIDNAPPGIYPDEAVNGEDALCANETGNYEASLFLKQGYYDYQYAIKEKTDTREKFSSR